jgi:hypothetical protein
MYNFYNTLSENRPAWRNAYEIKAAALEHEKRRFQLQNEEAAFGRPQGPMAGNRRSGWVTILEAPMRLLTILLG